MNIYVGNLAYAVTDEQLKQLFSSFGEVQSAKVIIDKITGKSKGFGFVEMEENAASEAIANINGQEFEGRSIRVSKANPANNDRSKRRPFNNRY